jgi:hypothetical protein
MGRFALTSVCEPISLARGEGEGAVGQVEQLARMADDADMTVRAFVLNALKDKGLDVRRDDLADLRKERQ